MRTTVDIPDAIYRRLKSEAALRRCSVKELLLRGAQAELKLGKQRHKKRTAVLPIIDSRKPGWLHLNNQKINEILFP